MIKILETERLYLREITSADAQVFYDLNSDDEVIKYTGDDAFKSVEVAKEFLENYPDYKKNGFGRWAVVRKVDEEILGWCGLKLNDDINEVDFGYRFFRKYWNKGYATEAAKACLDYGFNNLGFESIIARAMRENTASIKVIEKLGMYYEKEITCGGNPDSVQYRIYKNAYMKV